MVEHQGIVVTIVGTAFAFFVQFPQPALGTDHHLMLQSYDPEAAQRSRIRRSRLSLVGLAMLLIGGGLEVAAVVS